MKFWQELYDASAVASHACRGRASEDSAQASTISGDDDLDSSAPELVSGTPDTAEPELVDSEPDTAECGVFHLVNDPHGQHSLLQSTDPNAISCKPLDAPLVFRRVLAAVLPADRSASLQLSGDQMQKLSELQNMLHAQKQRPSRFKEAPVSHSNRRNASHAGKPKVVKAKAF